MELNENGTPILKCSPDKITEITKTNKIKRFKESHRFLHVQHPHGIFLFLVHFWGPLPNFEVDMEDESQWTELLEEAKTNAFIADLLLQETTTQNFDDWINVWGARILYLCLVAQHDDSWSPFLEKIRTELCQFDVDAMDFGKNKMEAKILTTRLKAYFYTVLAERDERYITDLQDVIQTVDPGWGKHVDMDQDAVQLFLADTAMMNSIVFRAKIKSLVNKENSAAELRKLTAEIVQYYHEVIKHEQYLPYMAVQDVEEMVNNLIKRHVLQFLYYPDIEAALHQIALNNEIDDFRIEFMKDILAIYKSDKFVELRIPYEDYEEFINTHDPCPTSVQRLKMKGQMPNRGKIRWRTCPRNGTKNSM